MNLLIIDVFDSFTYNLMHICEKYVKHVEVIRVNNININLLILKIVLYNVFFKNFEAYN